LKKPTLKSIINFIIKICGIYALGLALVFGLFGAYSLDLVSISAWLAYYLAWATILLVMIRYGKAAFTRRTPQQLVVPAPYGTVRQGGETV